MLQGIVFINLAFVLYTVGVWSEKIQGELKTGHLFLFWLGVLCDVLGTSAMETLAQNNVNSVVPTIFPFLSNYKEFHSLTGFMALALMVLHVCWATMIIVNKKEGWIKKFHRYSFIVWLVWLIPFISGILFHLS